MNGLAPRPLQLPTPIVCALAVVVALTACRSFPPATPVAAAPGALPLDATATDVRVHLLHVGDTLVTFDQFFGGNDGAVGFPGLVRMKSDPRRFWAPVMCALVIHPAHGPVLFDTCVSPRQNEPGYYEGVHQRVHEDDINRIPAGRELLAQLAALGVTPADVKHVIVSHLHEDHVGNLSAFPNATLHIAAAEWENRAHSPLWFPIYVDKSWAGVKDVRPLAFDDGAFGAFPAAEDLFGDGTVVVLPTFGHTPGHASLAVHSGDALVVLSGDAFYTLRHLHPPSLAAFGAYDEAWQALTHDAVARLTGLRDVFPSLDVVFVAQHDPFPETRGLLLSALADGTLTPAERRAILGHERSLYDEDGRLRPQAAPRFVPGSEATALEGVGLVGQVRDARP